MPSRFLDDDTPRYPSEDDGVLPGPWRAPTAAMAGSILVLAVLMLVGALLLG